LNSGLDSIISIYPLGKLQVNDAAEICFWVAILHESLGMLRFQIKVFSSWVDLF